MSNPATTIDDGHRPADFQPLDATDLTDMDIPAEGRMDAVRPSDGRASDSGPEADSVEAPIADMLEAAVQDGAGGGETAESSGPLSVKEVPHEPQEEKAQGPGAKARLFRTAACAVVLVLAAAGGLRLYFHLPRLRPAAELSAEPAERAPAELGRLPSAEPLLRTPPEEEPRFSWEAKFREIDERVQALLEKRNDIERLRRTYRYGILELEEEVAAWVRRTGVSELSQAVKNRQVEVDLLSLQRRLAYSAALEAPQRWLDSGSEELLYLKRRAAIDLQLKEAVQGLDMDRHLREIDSAMARLRPTAERLAIHTASLPLPGMEPLWRRLVERGMQAGAAEDARSREIVNEVCSGDLRRAADLSRLTLRAARCLAESGARELFLSNLADISPDAAGRLCEWRGDWLCLNGFRRLPADVAGRLFAWPGQWLSLNGLTELTAEAGSHLLNWRGRQLELMGLRKTDAVACLARWEEGGGRLFVSDPLRAEIDRLRKEGSGMRQKDGGG